MGDKEERRGEETITWNNDACRAETCLRPGEAGEDVGWVACDGCSKWFHQACLGLSTEQSAALEDIDYYCTECAAEEVGEAEEDAFERRPGQSQDFLDRMLDERRGAVIQQPPVQEEEEGGEGQGGDGGEQATPQGLPTMEDLHTTLVPTLKWCPKAARGDFAREAAAVWQHAASPGKSATSSCTSCLSGASSRPARARGPGLTGPPPWARAGWSERGCGGGGRGRRWSCGRRRWSCRG